MPDEEDRLTAQIVKLQAYGLSPTEHQRLRDQVFADPAARSLLNSLLDRYPL